jgi:hypothetical protein
VSLREEEEQDRGAGEFGQTTARRVSRTGQRAPCAAPTQAVTASCFLVPPCEPGSLKPCHPIGMAGHGAATWRDASRATSRSLLLLWLNPPVSCSHFHLYPPPLLHNDLHLAPRTVALLQRTASTARLSRRAGLSHPCGTIHKDSGPDG